MAGLEDLGKVISTDILIVGGGIGGLVAGIRAKETDDSVDVLIAEKQTIGYSGKAPKGAAVWMVLEPGVHDVDKFMDYHVKNIGFGLEDQELLYEYARDTYAAVQQIEEWGVKMCRTPDGKRYDLIANPATGLWGMVGGDLHMLLPLRKRARKLGAKFMNKIALIDLLKQGDRVVGAVGFNLISGEFHIIKAKATILANGGCNFRLRKMWAAGTGDGIAAAYRAGAEMRNVEFSNSSPDLLTINEGGADPRYIFNALGENISKKYMPQIQPDTPLSIMLGVEKEVREGRGPCYCDVSERPPNDMSMLGNVMSWDRPNNLKSWGKMMEKANKYGPPPQKKQEITIRVHSECAPVRVDHEMRTSLPGLWAIGDTSQSGSAWTGANPPPALKRGSGILCAAMSAMRAAPSAVRYALSASSPEADYSQASELKERIYAPMGRKEKALLPSDMVLRLQEAVAPVKYSIRRSGPRMEEALSIVKEVKEKLPELWARDGHGLCLCHEVAAMEVCAEMYFVASIMRTESRGTLFREDYPERDDKNWLKWIIVKQEDGKMKLSTEPVPMDKYKFKL